MCSFWKQELKWLVFILYKNMTKKTLTNLKLKFEWFSINHSSIYTNNRAIRQIQLICYDDIVWINWKELWTWMLNNPNELHKYNFSGVCKAKTCQKGVFTSRSINYKYFFWRKSPINIGYTCTSTPYKINTCCLFNQLQAFSDM